MRRFGRAGRTDKPAGTDVWGITSILCFAGALALFALTVVGAMNAVQHLAAGEETSLIPFRIMAIMFWVAVVAGATFGVVALCSRRRNKILGIIGLALNGLLLLSMVWVVIANASARAG